MYIVLLAVFEYNVQCSYHPNPVQLDRRHVPESGDHFCRRAELHVRQVHAYFIYQKLRAPT
eukprot:COSAG05_NODE_193_length_14574_cov_23.070812_9_plen_61_part_00